MTIPSGVYTGLLRDGHVRMPPRYRPKPEVQDMKLIGKKQKTHLPKTNANNYISGGKESLISLVHCFLIDSF